MAADDCQQIVKVVSDTAGELAYDVNTNTNYNAQAEMDAQVPVTGMQAVANFLGQELAKLRYQCGENLAVETHAARIATAE